MAEASLSTYHPSLGERLQSGFANLLGRVGVDPRYANHLGQRFFAAGNDLTPLGNVTMAADAGTMIRNGHPLQGLGLGALAVLPGAAGKVGKGMFGRGMKEWLGKKPFFHGTPDVSFDPAALDLNKTRRGNYGRGLYVSARPDIASSYAGQMGAVYPLQIADNARVLDLTTPDGRAIYEKLKSNEDALRQAYDVIRAPGESVILNRGIAKSVFQR